MTIAGPHIVASGCGLLISHPWRDEISLCWEGLEETDNEEAQMVRSVGWTIKHGQNIRHNSKVTIEYHIETESILLLKLLSMFGI